MKRHLIAHAAVPDRLRTSICAYILALIPMVLLPPVALAHSGDMNCDRVVNSADIPLFFEALLPITGFGGCDINRADMNADTLINARDLQPFVTALLAIPCGAPLVMCNGVCVDPTYDNGNCGSCGHHCSVDETCVGGQCEPSQPCEGC
jgi:hypothetical protein